jgi:pimeloyl-ACP methyl ester carboxylesterase
LISRVFRGQAEGLTRDDILDNAFGRPSLLGVFGKGYFNAKGVSIPVAVSVFPDELYPAPLNWAERPYPKLIHYNKLDTGGHFAAWEQPKLLSEEIRAGFRSLRKSN